MSPRALRLLHLLDLPKWRSGQQLLRRIAARRAGLTKSHAAVVVMVLAWCLVEVALQWRSQVRLGQSAMSAIVGQGDSRLDPVTGLNLFRPNARLGGREREIRTNSMGLRSAEIPFEKGPGVVRVAVLGASTVMGAYSASNDLTLPGRLEANLHQRFPNRSVEVINAGISGLSVREQAQLYEKLIQKYSPDVVVVYSGFNDFAGYCRTTKAPAKRQPSPLVQISLPKWLLSVELLVKNSTLLRETAVRTSRIIDASRLDLTAYQREFESLLAVIRRSGAESVVATNSKSYRRTQTTEMQSRLSGPARYYNACFDVDGLHTLYERHNAIIRTAASRAQVPLVPLHDLIPGGERYFADASHFSAAGDQLAADLIADVLANDRAFADKPAE